MADPTIFQALKADHDRQRKLMKEVGDLTGNSAKRRDLFEQLRLEIQSHAAAEEESLYANMLADPELREDARHSVSEHKEVDDTMGELMKLEMGSDEWQEKFYHMRRRYEHHIDEEEEEMFPEADKQWDKDKERELGAIYVERKPEELEEAKDNPPGSDERE
jgi:hypothetical protein